MRFVPSANTAYGGAWSGLGAVAVMVYVLASTVVGANGLEFVLTHRLPS